MAEHEVTEAMVGRAALLHYIDERASDVIGRPDKKAIFAEIGAAIRSDMARIRELEAALAARTTDASAASGQAATEAFHQAANVLFSLGYVRDRGEWVKPTGAGADADALLVERINALLSLDANGSLVPHGIGGHARALLAAAAKRLAP